VAPLDDYLRDLIVRKQALVEAILGLDNGSAQADE
jgi:hypothetical protein